MSIFLAILGFLLGLGLCLGNDKLNKPITIGGATLFGYFLSNILGMIFNIILAIAFLIFIYYAYKGYLDARKELKEEGKL